MAGARALAELPTLPFTEKLVDRLSDALLGEPAGQTVGMFVGPEVQGRRMLMQLRPGGIAVPFSAEEAVELGSRAVGERAQAVLAAPPMQTREAVFGWADPGVNPDRPVKLSYGKVEGAPRLAPALMQALAALNERAGLQAGDALVNAPYGLKDGDYQRAKAYMAMGFGPPTQLGDQVARLGRGGQLSPELITSVHQPLAMGQGWVVG